MMLFLLHQSLFLAILFALFFAPGWFLLRAAFDRSRFTIFEWTILSSTASITLLVFSMLSLDAARIRFTSTSLTVTLVGLCLIFASIAFLRNHGRTDNHRLLFLPSGFSRTESSAITAIFLLMIFIKTLYLIDAGVPSSTDMGHHMYWAKIMTETGSVPSYVERDIIQSGEDYLLADPKPIADFIVGEHLPFAALAILSGTDFVSSFPVIVLFLINLLSAIALFVLAWRLFYNESAESRTYTWTALLTLLFIGPIYALSSPQAKFVSGGVIGNTLGNLFIPVLILTYYRAFKEHDSRFLTLGFLLTFGLAYIHHLSMFVFLFVALAVMLWFSFANWRTLGQRIRAWVSLLFRPAPIFFIAGAILFFLFVSMPSYANPEAIDTAVGAPTKDTRTGLSLLQLADSTGPARLGLGLASLVIFIWPKSRRRYASAFLIGWGGILLAMTLRPQWLLVDIPSNRIGTYVISPLALLSAWIVTRIARRLVVMRDGVSIIRFPQTIAVLSVALLIVTTISAGYFDNSQALLTNKKDQETVETFAVSSYLATRTDSQDMLLKDHNYITADAWMKLFFLRGYTYPLSRAYFKRYEDETKPREQCTLWMISAPNTAQGSKCFDDTGTDIVVVNPVYDGAQFRKSPKFSLIYTSNSLAVYHRKADSGPRTTNHEKE